MKKEDLVLQLASMYEVKNCVIRRVYGVSCGVGYDLDVTIMNNQTGEITMIQAHANNHGWYYPNHLRPNNPYYKYTGTCDRYQSRVMSAWTENKCALEHYFRNFKKIGLECFIENGL